jgi:hypothetical protein
MGLCQPYMREQHPMQQHAAAGGSTAFGLNPRAFDVMAQQHAERSLDPRMQSRGFLGMPGGATAANLAAGGGGAASTTPSKNALKNARKRANKKARAAAAVPGSAPPVEEDEDYIRHCEEQQYVDNDPDCNYCHPQSGCDGDHGDEMRGGFIVRKGAVAWNPAVAALPPGQRWLASEALGGGPASGSSIVHDTAVPARPPPLKLGGGCSVNYGFSAAEGAHSPRLAAEDEDEEAGCATPCLLSCSELECARMSAEGGMEAVD